MSDRIRIRRDTAANWTTANPILRTGEKGVETDTRLSKTGNSVDDWGTLQYDKGAAHASDHFAGGDDEITPDDIGAARIDPGTGKLDATQLPDTVQLNDVAVTGGTY